MKMCFDAVPIFSLVQWSKLRRCGVFRDMGGFSGSRVLLLSMKNIDLL